MNIFATVKARVDAAVAALVAEGKLPSGLDLERVAAEPPRDPSHGDVTTNAAMILAKPAGQAPKAIAELLIAKRKADPSVTEASVAGPGFINLRLVPSTWYDVLRDVLQTGPSFGDV